MEKKYYVIRFLSARVYNTITEMNLTEEQAIAYARYYKVMYPESTLGIAYTLKE